MNYPLVRLAHWIDGNALEEQIDALYNRGSDQPPLPTRLLIGLFNESDETLVERRMHKNVNTTAQEKAISLPTDAKLYHKVREVFIKQTQQQEIDLTQSCSMTT